MGTNSMQAEGGTQRLIRVRRPTAVFEAAAQVKVPKLDRSIVGVRVGLRQDTWRSWRLICNWWAQWLARDGAIPVPLFTGERTGDEGNKTRADLAAWGGNIDCAISGLGT